MPDTRSKQQSVGACDSSREGWTGAKFGMKISERIGRSCLGHLQTKAISTLTKEITFVKFLRKKKTKLCRDPRDIHPAFAIRVVPPQDRMIVCYDRHDRFQQIPFVDFSRVGLTGFKFGVKIWTRIGESCLGLLQTKTDQNNVEHQRRKIRFVKYQ
jgi:hypothetical protein